MLEFLAFVAPGAMGRVHGWRWRIFLQRGTGRSCKPAFARTTRPRCCAAGGGARGYDPVEPGVQLPRLAHDALADEQKWLADAITDWLDTEWRTSEPVAVHATIGKRVGQIYGRQRMEGEDDLSGVLLAIGQELESFDMSETFVGAFNIANKVADLLLLERSGPREQEPAYQRDPNAPSWSEEKDREVTERQLQQSADTDVADELAVGQAIPPKPLDPFDRHVFLKSVLDGSVPTRVVSGMLAHIVGFKYDPFVGRWHSAKVKDEYFKAFGDTPPNDVIADDDTIAHLEDRLEDGDDDGVRAEGLEVVVETLHGMEMSKIQRNSGDDEFRRRCVLAKFFHLHGGF